MAFPAKKKSPDMALILGLGKSKRSAAPPSFGEDESLAEEAAEAALEPAGDEGGGSIPPEAVCYRDESMTCGACAYMMEDGSCSKLNIPVTAGAGCNLFSGNEQSASDMEAPAEQPIEGMVA